MNPRRAAVVVVDYDPAWPALFTELRAAMWPHVTDLAIGIEHVGSTSVPGLAAKPVIDLDVVIPSRAVLPAVTERFLGLGYTYIGDLGIADREAFREPPDQPRHNLYVCPADSIGLRNHLAVRDHLRTSAADAVAYAALKRELAERFPFDVDRYADGKSDFILAILARYGFSSDRLDAIREANRVAAVRPQTSDA